MRIMRVTQSFQAATGGFAEGALVPDSHPLVGDYPMYFEAADDYVSRQYPHLVGGVEQATAGPGEKRARTRPQQRAKKTDE